MPLVLAFRFSASLSLSRDLQLGDSRFTSSSLFLSHSACLSFSFPLSVCLSLPLNGGLTSHRLRLISPKLDLKHWRELKRIQLHSLCCVCFLVSHSVSLVSFIWWVLFSFPPLPSSTHDTLHTAIIVTNCMYTHTQWETPERKKEGVEEQ